MKEDIPHPKPLSPEAKEARKPPHPLDLITPGDDEPTTEDKVGIDAPDEAHSLARLIASGLSIAEASTQLDLTAEEAAEIVSSSNWVELVRSYHTSDEIVRDEFMNLVPLAIKTKREILTSPEASPALRDRVASDILERVGYDRVGRREAPSMAPPNVDHIKAIFVELFRSRDEG